MHLQRVSIRPVNTKNKASAYGVLCFFVKIAPFITKNSIKITFSSLSDIVLLYCNQEVIIMKKNPLISTKNIFCVLTVSWSVLMLIEYLVCIVPIQLNDFLFEIFDFLLIFLYLGIWGLPIVFVISIILMAIVKVKYKNSDEKRLNILTIVIPLFLAGLMFLTNFNEQLQ